MQTSGAITGRAATSRVSLPRRLSAFPPTDARATTRLARASSSTSEDAHCHADLLITPPDASPSTSGQPTSSSAPPSPAGSRRGALLSAAAAAAASAAPLLGLLAAAPPPASARVRSAADAKAVGSYLPLAPAAEMGVPEGYVLYAPDERATPSMRAGVIRPPLYRWAIAPSFRQEPIVNALTGNFCFPNCVEPWYEYVASDPELGKIYLCIIILKKLLPSSRDDGGGATVESLGDAEGVARALGPLVTGQGYEDEDLVSSRERKTGEGQVFYDLELMALTADPSGPRRLAAVTVKGGLVYLFVGAATERQWKAGGEGALRAMVQSFRA